MSKPKRINFYIAQTLSTLRSVLQPKTRGVSEEDGKIAYMYVDSVTGERKYITTATSQRATEDGAWEYSDETFNTVKARNGYSDKYTESIPLGDAENTELPSGISSILDGLKRLIYHDNLEGKNSNPNFLHTTQTQQDDWDDKVDDDDPRLSDAREWTADTVSQSEAEAGTATTRRAWTAQRVRQAIVSWWDSISVAWDKITDKPSKFPPEEHGDSAHSEDYAKSDDLDDYVPKNSSSDTLITRDGRGFLLGTDGRLRLGVDGNGDTVEEYSPLMVNRIIDAIEYLSYTGVSIGINSNTAIMLQLRDQTNGVNVGRITIEEDGTIVAPNCTNAGVDAGVPETLVTKKTIEERGLNKWETYNSEDTLPSGDYELELYQTTTDDYTIDFDINSFTGNVLENTEGDGWNSMDRFDDIDISGNVGFNAYIVKKGGITSIKMSHSRIVTGNKLRSTFYDGIIGGLTKITYSISGSYVSRIREI